jgi:hypothetical protein
LRVAVTVSKKHSTILCCDECSIILATEVEVIWSVADRKTTGAVDLCEHHCKD